MSFKIDNKDGNELTSEIIDSCDSAHLIVHVNKGSDFIVSDILKDRLKSYLGDRKITQWRITEDNFLVIGG